MSERKESVFKFRVILPWIIMVCIVFSLQIQCEKGGQEEAPSKDQVLSPLSAVDIIHMEKKFRKDLEDKYFSFLKNHFNQVNDINYEEIADKMVEYGTKITFYDFEGTQLTDKDAYIQFWENVRAEEYTFLEITVLSLRVLPVSKVKELGPPKFHEKDTIIATGHAVFLFSFTKGKSNNTAIGVYTSRHPRWCEW